MTNNTTVLIDDGAQTDMATSFAKTHSLRLSRVVDGDGLYVIFSNSGVILALREAGCVSHFDLDYTAGSVAHRRHFGGGKAQLIGKAVGLNKGFKPSILDATAGVGRDAFVLASLGAQVTMCERSPVLNLLLRLAIDQAEAHGGTIGDQGLVDTMRRMDLRCVDSIEYLSDEGVTAEIIYLDPMFPDRKKSARVKKEMRILHHLIGSDQDASVLLERALDRAMYRVVVKRPRIAPFLADMEPSYQLEGKSSRFDIYAKKALPL